MSSKTNGLSYSKPLSKEKDSSNVKKNQTSKQTREGLAYNTGDPPSVENTSSKKSRTINASNMSYSSN